MCVSCVRLVLKVYFPSSQELYVLQLGYEDKFSINYNVMKNNSRCDNKFVHTRAHTFLLFAYCRPLNKVAYLKLALAVHSCSSKTVHLWFEF